MKNNKGHVCQQAGFSLIELLVVISIIGILTTVLVMNFVGSRDRAHDAQKIQNLNSIKNALRMYYNDNQSYPDTWVNFIGTSGYIATGLGTSDYTYTRTSNGDGFILTTSLDIGAGDEDINSQIGCGITNPPNGVYAVCAN